MLEVADALAEVLRHARPLPPAAAPLSPDLLGRVLAADVLADRDSPPFAKSLRDGYAVRAADCGAGAELVVVEEIPAGVVPAKTVGPGECARIFTGAPIPDGADAVVMQEDTQRLEGGRVRVTDSAVRPGQWVYPRGHEMRAGDVVLPAGTAVNPAALGVLATVGAARVTAFPRPRVAVLSTGNEVVEAARVPGPGGIRNSNGPMLAGQVVRAGGDVLPLGIARDDEAELAAKVRDGLAADVLLLAGGVSAGAFDLVPGVLAAAGVFAHFHRVRMKPGKPLLFGTRGGTLVFGLPGNPVSAFVCFELFVRPALRVLAGNPDPGPVVAELPMAEPFSECNDRPTYRPAKLERAEVGWAVRPLPWSGAPDLLGLQPADALLALPAADARYAAGQPAPVVVL